jgi:hypothetical protein
MAKPAKYHCGPLRNRWAIWDSDGCKVEDRNTREEARKRVYELNGWKFNHKKDKDHERKQ